MLQKVILNNKTIELDSEKIYKLSDEPDDEEKLFRKALELPIKKGVIYYTDKKNKDSAVSVISIRLAEMYEITERWYTLEIFLANGSNLFIHSAYLSEMQKPDFINDISDIDKQNHTPARQKRIGKVSNRILSRAEIPMLYNNRFIAFDVETTGFNLKRDRIIELGAVVFENGLVVDRFSSLVNAKKKTSDSAMAVNHITQDMIDSAPSEKEVYTSFVSFLEDAVNGKTFLCAHNAQFDKDFLAMTLQRLGVDADLLFVDTLALSRKLFPGLNDYKLKTVAEYCKIINLDAHMAASDAETCGHIFLKLLPVVLNQNTVTANH